MPPDRLSTLQCESWNATLNSRSVQIGSIRGFRQVILAEKDFAACRDLYARAPQFSADILAPVAREFRLAAIRKSFRQKGPALTIIRGYARLNPPTIQLRTRSANSNLLNLRGCSGYVTSTQASTGENSQAPSNRGIEFRIRCACNSETAIKGGATVRRQSPHSSIASFSPGMSFICCCSS